VRDVGERSEPLRPLQRAAERRERHRLLDGAVERDRTARVRERARDVAAGRAAARADHDHRNPLAGQAVAHQYRVGVLDERLRGVALL